MEVSVTPHLIVPSAILRRLALLAAVAMAMIAILAVSPDRAQAITPETSPDGAHATSPKISTGQAQAVSSGQTAPMICSGHGAEYGNWANADPNASGIARIELRDCQPVTTCTGDTCTVTYDAGWIMHVFGKCSPTNCDWG